MNEQEKCIKLALVMGWTHVPAVGPYAFIRWKVKDGEDIGLMNNIQPFDPFTDANDCNALIRFLQSKEYEPTIAFRIGYDVVTMHDRPKILSWQGDNWMHGVCELALKVSDRTEQEKIASPRDLKEGT